MEGEKQKQKITIGRRGKKGQFKEKHEQHVKEDTLPRQRNTVETNGEPLQVFWVLVQILINICETENEIVTGIGNYRKHTTFDNHLKSPTLRGRFCLANWLAVDFIRVEVLEKEGLIADLGLANELTFVMGL